MNQDKANQQLTVTVRAPNGATEQLVIHSHDRADKVTREAVTEFREAKQIAEGDYDLALARSGQPAILIAPSTRVDELEFDPQGDVFLLINKKPQVDG